MSSNIDILNMTLFSFTDLFNDSKCTMVMTTALKILQFSFYDDVIWQIKNFELIHFKKLRSKTWSYRRNMYIWYIFIWTKVILDTVFCNTYNLQELTQFE